MNEYHQRGALNTEQMIMRKKRDSDRSLFNIEKMSFIVPRSKSTAIVVDNDEIKCSRKNKVNIYIKAIKQKGLKSSRCNAMIQ